MKRLFISMLCMLNIVSYVNAYFIATPESQNFSESNIVQTTANKNSNIVKVSLNICNVSSRIVCEAGRISGNLLFEIANIFSKQKQTSSIRKNVRDIKSDNKNIPHVFIFSRDTKSKLIKNYSKKNYTYFKFEKENSSKYKNLIFLALLSFFGIYKFILRHKQRSTQIRAGNENGICLKNFNIMNTKKAFEVQKNSNAFFMFNKDIVF